MLLFLAIEIMIITAVARKKKLLLFMDASCTTLFGQTHFMQFHEYKCFWNNNRGLKGFEEKNGLQTDVYRLRTFESKVRPEWHCH